MAGLRNIFMQKSWGKFLINLSLQYEINSLIILI